MKTSFLSTKGLKFSPNKHIIGKPDVSNTKIPHFLSAFYFCFIVMHFCLSFPCCTGHFRSLSHAYIQHFGIRIIAFHFKKTQQYIISYYADIHFYYCLRLHPIRPIIWPGIHWDYCLRL